MHPIKKLIATLGIITLTLQAHGADKYTDENRPYEFGFKIDGEQHRHESKDVNGIIMGEYGFITADGVYHVTVYATDENGNFKILSMKNIRVKPYPTSPSKTAAPSNQPSPQLPASVQQKQKPKQKSLEPPTKSCSSCSIPTTPPPVNYNVQQNDISSVSQNNPNSPSYGNDYNNPQTSQQDNYPNYPPYPQDNQENTQSYNQPDQKFNPQLGNSGFSNPQNNPQYNGQPGAGQSPYDQQNPQYPPQQSPYDQQNPQYPPQQSPYDQQNPQYPPQQSFAERNPKQYDPQSNYASGPNKPVLISAQMQIVDKNTDVYARGPGEKPGLPDGLTKNDMMLLLYTFNYTLGFHGHHEEGYTNGAKVGYYFITGRNGVRTRVDYVADENGFRPTITQEVLDVLSDDVPKPETEKDEKYGLKGYEFKWIYYPVQSKR